MAYTTAPEDNETIANLPGDIRAVTAAVTAHTNAASGAHAASAISVKATGTLAATTVQAAVAQLDATVTQLNTTVSDLDTIVGDLDSGKLPLSGGSMTGPIAMSGNKITGLANGSVSGDAVNYGQLAAVIPPGVISPYAGSTAPGGYLLCDGTAVSRTTYAALFSAIGTTFGTGDGNTTFNLPDMRDKLPLGKGTTYSTLAATGGEATHTLTTEEMPSHSHDEGSNDYYGDADKVVASSKTTCEGQTPYGRKYKTANTGGGSAHNNMPPYIVLNYCIKY